MILQKATPVVSGSSIKKQQISLPTHHHHEPNLYLLRLKFETTQSQPQPLFPLSSQGSSHDRQSITRPRRWYAVRYVFGTRYLQFKAMPPGGADSGAAAGAESIVVGGAGRLVGGARSWFGDARGLFGVRGRSLCGGSGSLFGGSDIVAFAISVVRCLTEGCCAVALAPLRLGLIVEERLGLSERPDSVCSF